VLILVDTSIWIDYFRGTETHLDELIDNNLLATNAIILAELLPSLWLRRENDLASLLQDIRCLPKHSTCPAIRQRGYTKPPTAPISLPAI